jgi:hypothetical protein
MGRVSSHLTHTAVLACTMAVAFQVSFVLVRKGFCYACLFERIAILRNYLKTRHGKDRRHQPQAASVFSVWLDDVCRVARVQCQRYNAVSMSYTLCIIGPYHDRSVIALAPVNAYRRSRVLDAMRHSAQTATRRFARDLRGIRPHGRSAHGRGGKDKRGLGRPPGALLLPVAGQWHVLSGW